MKKALITGVAGQDGSYLVELLLSKDYEVFGLAKIGSDLKWVPSGTKVIYGDLTDVESLKKAVRKSAPDEVYNVGGITDLKTAYEFPELTFKVNYESVGVLINECLRLNPKARFLQASSSEILLPSPAPLNEESPRDWKTKNPYAQAKMKADKDFIAGLRESKNAFACSAILFNHDSPRRLKSVTKKITQTLVRIKSGKEKCLKIGNPDMLRDWGFAGDYVKAMHLMLQTKKPEDLVLATGRLHSVRDFIDVAGRLVGLDFTWKGEGVGSYAVDNFDNKVIEVVPEFYKPTETYSKVGDASKAGKMISWKPHVTFEEFAKIMVDADLKGE